jgi:hypothetical protein
MTLSRSGQAGTFDSIPIAPETIFTISRRIDKSEGQKAIGNP